MIGKFLIVVIFVNLSVLLLDRLIDTKRELFCAENNVYFTKVRVGNFYQLEPAPELTCYIGLK